MSRYIFKAMSVMRTQIRGIELAAEKLDESFKTVIEGLLACSGRVILTGAGKSGIIAQKLAATLASTGTPSFFIHPSDAAHGDLGAVTGKDIVFMLSNSGESSELIQLVPSLKRMECRIFLMTMRRDSTLAQHADLALVLPPMKEADPLQLAPTVSATVMLIVGDAIAIILMQEKNFNKEDFALFHPGGSLGKKLVTRVKDLMKTTEEIPMVTKDVRLSEAIFEISQKGLGATVVVEHPKSRMIAGLITDGDIRRLLDHNREVWNFCVEQVMNPKPVLVGENMLAIDALKEMKNYKISVLPVIDEKSRLIGIIHMHHIIMAGVV